jgi:hypothetical protein
VQPADRDLIPARGRLAAAIGEILASSPPGADGQPTYVTLALASVALAISAAVLVLAAPQSADPSRGPCRDGEAWTGQERHADQPRECVIDPHIFARQRILRLTL